MTGMILPFWHLALIAFLDCTARHSNTLHLLRMPAENNNPWSGELKAKRQKSKGKSDPCSPPVKFPSSEPFLTKSPTKDNGQKPETINSNEEVRRKSKGENSEGAQINTHTQSGEEIESKLGESTENMLKNTRRNLKPVSQLFSRSESTNRDNQEESPADRLTQQGSLEWSQELSSSSRNGGMDASPRMQGMLPASNGEGKRYKLFFQICHQHKYLLRALKILNLIFSDGERSRWWQFPW